FALSIYVILFLSSCGGNDESAFAVKQKLVSTNRAEIQYTNGKSVQVEANQPDIRVLKNAITEQDFDGNDCATDGKIVFYMQNMPVETVEFAIKPDCNYVYYQHQDKPYKKAISAAALKYLQEQL
ncbi:MAG: hypothetical protein ACXWDO_08125, partial [Bacteroidia bacterium]